MPRLFIVIMDMIKNNRWLLYDWNGSYKGGKDKTTNATGGYITIKNKPKNINEITIFLNVYVIKTRDKSE